jgi:hypothetical protein
VPTRSICAPSEFCVMSWFWEIQQSDSGPDYYLTLEFAASTEQLIAWAEPLLNTYQRDESGYTPHLWYHADSREWDYTAVEIRDGCLVVTRGGGNDHPAVDNFLQPLLSERSLLLKRWRVSAGGDGYATKYFRSGIDLPSFQNYCAGKSKTPNFSRVLQHLRQALSTLKTDTLYKLGEPEIQGNTITVPVFYPVLFKDGAWLTYPADQELSDVAREVSDRCNVPALASATSLHEPNNFQQVIGGTFYFG